MKGVQLRNGVSWMRRRVKLLQARLADADVGFAAIMPGANFRYFTGQPKGVSERITMLIIPLEGEPALIAPLLEAGGLQEACRIDNVFSYRDGESPGRAFREAVSELALEGPVGCEYTGMRMLELSMWERALPDAGYRDITDAVAGLRSIKDSREIQAMEEAVAIVEDVFSDVARMVAPGVSERDLALAVQRGLAERESGLVYPGAVASGERSAFPHAGPSDRRLQAGDLVWFDVCAERNGYHSDLTRTFYVDEPPQRLRDIYRVVYEAQKKARESIVPGMTCGEVDGICRRYIDDAGYGEYFTHRTGHGLGLEIHEPPYIVEGDHTVLRPGMTFTVEPGIYLPGEGGVRIEDDVVITEDGCRSLTTFPRHPHIS